MKQEQEKQEEHTKKHPQHAALKQERHVGHGHSKNDFSELATVSFIFSILGFILPLFGPLATVLGIGGLMQIKRLNLRGKTLAILAIVFGSLMTVVVFVAIAFGIGYLEQYGGIGGLIEKSRAR